MDIDKVLGEASAAFAMAYRLNDADYPVLAYGLNARGLSGVPVRRAFALGRSIIQEVWGDRELAFQIYERVVETGEYDAPSLKAHLTWVLRRQPDSGYGAL
jgi:hypothetical protein